MKTLEYYTIEGKTDGFGAQYQAIMSGIAYCDYAKKIYVHTPLKHIEHIKNVKALNVFIGIPRSTLNVKLLKEPFSAMVHYAKNPDLFYTKKVIHKIKKYYYSTWKPKIQINDIAIHIRRGDVKYNKNQERYTSNEIYKEIIKKLRTQFPSYKITIHSQGSVKDFADLIVDNKVKLSLNEDIRITFHSLVTAKVLVMSKSSFSYSAAILNDNIILYMPFWHKPLNHWKIISGFPKKSEFYEFFVPVICISFSIIIYISTI